MSIFAFTALVGSYAADGLTAAIQQGRIQHADVLAQASLDDPGAAKPASTHPRSRCCAAT
jgi:hypothetical protein